MKKYLLGILSVICAVAVLWTGCSVFVSAAYVQEPQLADAENFNGYVNLTWKKSKSADSYRIYRRTDTGKWGYYKTVGASSLSYKDSAVENGVTYSYRVVAMNGSTMSTYSADGISVSYVDVPQNIETVGSYYNGVHVSWSKVSGAVKYYIYRKDTVNKSWQLIFTTKALSYHDKNLTDGRQYTYTVRALHQNGGFSHFLSGTKQVVLHKPTVLLTSVATGVRLDWDKNSYSTGYIVYRKNYGADSYKRIAALKSNSQTSYVDKTTVAGTRYTYTVRPVKGDMYGSYEKDGFSIKYTVPPTLTVELSPKGNIVSWTKNASAHSYVLYRKAEGEKSYTKLGQFKGSNTLSYTDKNPVLGKKNYYVVLVYGTGLKSNTDSVYGIDPNKKMVALTYDDGPYAPATNRILDCLKKYDGRATFFVVGSRVNSYKDCIKRAYSQGSEIANHTYSHKTLTSISVSEMNSQIEKTNQAVKAITGEAPVIVRAPGGSANSTVKSNLKYPLIFWSVDTLDWKTGSSAATVSAIKKNVRDGSIVLMHDLYNSTAAATEDIVPWLVANGYQIVTVSEMMAVKGIDMENGVQYSKAY